MKVKKYIKLLKKGIFLEAFNLIKKKPKLYLFMLLMDVCFILGILLIGKMGNLAVQHLLRMNPIDVLISMFFYILLMMVVYSFTKFFALHFVKNMLKKTGLKLSQVGMFFLLNMVCIAFVLALFLVLNSIILASVKEAYVRSAARFILFVLSLFTFAFISIAHSLFALGLSFKDVLKKCFKLTFNRINAYYGVFAVNALVFGVFFGIV